MLQIAADWNVEPASYEVGVYLWLPPSQKTLLFPLLIHLWRDVCCIGSPTESDVCVSIHVNGERWTGGEVWARSTVRSGLVISPRTTSFLLLVVVQTQTRYGSTTLDTTNTRRLCYSLHCTYGTWRPIDFRYIYTYITRTVGLTSTPTVSFILKDFVWNSQPWANPCMIHKRMNLIRIIWTSQRKIALFKSIGTCKKRKCVIHGSSFMNYVLMWLWLLNRNCVFPKCRN